MNKKFSTKILNQSDYFTSFPTIAGLQQYDNNLSEVVAASLMAQTLKIEGLNINMGLSAITDLVKSNISPFLLYCMNEGVDNVFVRHIYSEFLRLHFVESGKEEQLFSFPEQNIVWHFPHKSNDQLKASFQINIKNGSDVVSNTDLIVLTGMFSLEIYNNIGRFHIEELNINIPSNKTVRFSQGQLSRDARTSSGRNNLPFVENSEFANLSAKSDCVDFNFICQRNVMAVKPNSSDTALMNGNIFWEYLNKSIQHPTPASMHRLLDDLIKQYGIGKVDNTQLFTETNVTQKGDFCGLPVYWWSAFFGDKHQLIEKLAFKTKNQQGLLNDCTKMVNILKKISFNGSYQGVSGLLLLALNGKWDLLSKLDEQSAIDIDSCFLSASHPLHRMNFLSFAIRDERWDWVEKLLSRGADVQEFHHDNLLNPKGNWLFKLMMNKKWSYIAEIISKNDSIIQKNGKQLLYFSAMESQWDVVSELLRRDNFSNNMFIEFANYSEYFRKNKSVNPTVVQLILSRLVSSDACPIVFESVLSMLERLYENYLVGLSASHSGEDIYPHLFHVFGENHAYEGLSAILVLASINDKSLAHFDQRRFLLIQKWFTYYEDSIRMSPEYPVMLDAKKGGYHYSLAAFFAQCGQVNLLKRVYELTEIKPTLAWFEERTNAYAVYGSSKPVYRIRERHHSDLIELLDTAHTLQNFKVLEVLVKMSEIEFASLFALEGTPNRFKYLVTLAKQGKLLECIKSNPEELTVSKTKALLFSQVTNRLAVLSDSNSPLRSASSSTDGSKDGKEVDILFREKGKEKELTEAMIRPLTI